MTIFPKYIIRKIFSHIDVMTFSRNPIFYLLLMNYRREERELANEMDYFLQNVLNCNYSMFIKIDINYLQAGDKFDFHSKTNDIPYKWIKLPECGTPYRESISSVTELLVPSTVFRMKNIKYSIDQYNPICFEIYDDSSRDNDCFKYYTYICINIRIYSKDDLINYIKIIQYLGGINGSHYNRQTNLLYLAIEKMFHTMGYIEMKMKIRLYDVMLNVKDEYKKYCIDKFNEINKIIKYYNFNPPSKHPYVTTPMNDLCANTESKLNTWLFR